MRADIERHLRHKLNLTHFGSGAMMQAIIDVICSNLIEGNTIDLRSVGKFETPVNNARLHHVVTEKERGKMKMTPARRVLRFSPSKILRARMIENFKLRGQT